MSRMPSTSSKVREAGGVGSGSNSSQMNRRNVRLQSYGSKGEEFFEFLKNLGFEPSAKQRPEHLQYAFNNDNSPTTKLVRRIMARVKKENALDPEEVQSYEKLKSDGYALYGKDLEEAVDRRNTFEKKLSAEQNSKALEKERLQQLITQRKAEILEIHNRSLVINEMFTATRESQSKAQVIASRFQRESKDLDQEIQVSQKRLNDKTEALIEMKNALLADENALPHHMKNAQGLVAINWEEIIQSENGLINDIRPLIQQHVADLIIRADGYENSNNNSQDADFLRRLLVKHAGHFERLIHCIIYERVRQSQLEIELAGQKAALSMWTAFSEPARRAKTVNRNINDFGNVQGLDESINTLESVFEREYGQVVEDVREAILNQLNLQFATLDNVKAHSKKRLHSFFLRVYSSLASQKVRVDLLRNVVKAEVAHYRNLMKKLQEHNQRIYCSDMEVQFIGGDLNFKDLTPAGFALQEFFAQQKIPSSILRSVPGTMDALMKMHREIIISKGSSSRKENVEFKQRLQDLNLQQHQLTELYSNLKENYYSNNSTSRRRLQELETIQRKMEDALKTREENRLFIVEESITEKIQLLSKMKVALE